MKLNKHFDRVSIALSEYNFTFKFSQVTFDKFYPMVKIRYGTGSETYSMKGLDCMNTIRIQYEHNIRYMTTI